MRVIRIGLLGVLLVCAVLVSPARAAGLLELKVRDDVYRGRLVAHNREYCWLMDRDGRLNQVRVSLISEYRTISEEFRRYSAADMRDALRREFGNEFEISATSHFLVCGSKGQAAKYAPLFEEVYRSFHGYLSSRGLKFSEPEFPLVALVFPDQKAFAQYSRKDGVPARPGLMGYYIPTTNRIAVFDSAQAAAGDATSPNGAMSASRSLPVDSDWFANIEAGLHDTIVHETTHQVAFNTGLHSRVGESPRWVVEGLATVFESPGIRDSHGTTPDDRVNRERLVWFKNFAKTRRKPGLLAKFVADDSMFAAQALDAYSQAWALSFYLIETRSSEYAKYLRLILQRDPTGEYAAAARLEDFKKAFGSDLETFDAQFLRFIERLKVSADQIVIRRFRPR